MSRSRKHHPIMSFTTAKSEKKDKRIYNRNLRHKIKQDMKQKDVSELEEYITPIKNEIIDPWSMDKDGKQRVPKDSIWYKKCMRK